MYWGMFVIWTGSMKLAEQFNLEIIEDSTESLGSVLQRGKHTGGFGLMGCFSFNGNKIITTGGGGVIVTHNEELAKKAKASYNPGQK